MAGIIFCILLVGEESLGVLNKSSSKNINDEENKISQGLEDRISNEYGAPPRQHFDGPAPVYGPPELTGNHGQQQIYPPPPADIPPPVVPLGPGPGSIPRPEPIYGAPPRIQPQFGPRPIKLAPWKLSSGRYPTKPAGHGPPIPISLESYGPPNNFPPPNFSIPRPQNQYGPPQPFPVLPPFPQLPPPGVPAPPTPPEIKYDGWQPIAGHIETPQIYQQPEQHNANVNVNVDANIPSNSYGEPISNQEDHNLRQAVAPSDKDAGLPPPQLPEDEPFHNIQEPAKDIDTLPKPSKIPTFSTSFENDINNHDDLSSFQQQQLPTSPGVSDSYGPPSPSFSANGPYPPAPGPSGFGGSSFNKQTFKQHRQQHSFNNFPHQRNSPPSFRPQSPPHGVFSPPRNRAPLKFRESIPSSLLNSIHRYRQFGPAPSHSPSGNFVRPSLSLQQQQPPALNNAVSFHGGVQSFDNSAVAAPNVNYGTPLTFKDFNTPSPVLTYGAPNFGPSGSFISSSSTIGGGNGNLYQQNSIGGLSTSYGNPLPAPQFQFHARHTGDCSHNNLGFNNLNSDQSQFRQVQINTEPVQQIDSDFQLPQINQLELEPQIAISHIDIKDSYGNPAGVTSDLRTAQSAPTGHSAEAFTAALTAQGYSQQSSNNLASTNELNIDQLAQLQSEPALAIAQTLSAEGASDGFQIQGSKGLYTLQIQPANEPHANENSDGTIRHDKLLSNGLLQDILAAIEQPGQGGPAQLISIQGSPQEESPQTTEQNDYEHRQDLLQSASSSAVTSEVNADVNTQTMNSENVALFFNNNNTHEESNKEIRSTSKNEGNAGETTSQNPSESEKPSQETPQS